jgi:hypothetical protein
MLFPSAKHRLIRRCFTRVLAILSLILVPSCNNGTGQPPVNFTIDYGNFQLDLPSGESADTERAFLFYAGAPTTSFQMNVRVSNLPTGSTISVGSGRATLIETLTQTDSGLEARTGNGDLINAAIAAGTDGRVATQTIPGNVGRLQVRTPSGGLSRPKIIVESLSAVRPASYAMPPTLVTEMSDSVTAMPLPLGQPVELGFPAESTTYYFSISGLSDQSVDVAVFGTGRFRIKSAGLPGFPLTDDDAIQVLPETRSGNRTLVGFARQNVPDSGSLTFAVTNEGASPQPGHARFVVLSLAASVKLSFPSSQPGQFLPGNIGIDHDSSRGTRGPSDGHSDCLNWEGTRGVTNVLGVWVPVFKGGVPICYDDHPGLDYLLPLSLIQQQVMVPVNAASSGIVLSVEDGNADTCFADPFNGFKIKCPNSTLPSNFVLVRQDDGLFAYYIHVRKQLVTVQPGDRVACGEKLGAVGSAGESATSHLHFELRRLRDGIFDSDGLSSYHWKTVREKSDTVDPFNDNLWRQVTNGMPESRCN